MIQTSLAYYTGVLYKNFVSYSAAELSRYQLNFGLIFFIIFIGKHPGCSPTDLTRALDLDWGHSQRSTNKLIQNGLVLKAKAARHSRSYQLTLSDKGLEVFDFCYQLFANWDQEILAQLTSAERTCLLSLLNRLSLNMSENGANK